MIQKTVDAATYWKIHTKKISVKISAWKTIYNTKHELSIKVFSSNVNLDNLINWFVLGFICMQIHSVFFLIIFLISIHLFFEPQPESVTENNLLYGKSHPNTSSTHTFFCL